MNLHVAYTFDNLGHTAETDDNTHIRNLIWQVLFTTPGERVNRPDFGSGLLQLVFQPNSSELAATTQFLVQGALRQWLGDLIDVSEVEVISYDAQLLITIAYTVLRSRQRYTVQFTR